MYRDGGDDWAGVVVGGDASLCFCFGRKEEVEEVERRLRLAELGEDGVDRSKGGVDLFAELREPRQSTIKEHRETNAPWLP